MDENPYRPPETIHEPPESGPPVSTITTTLQKIGTAILLIGVAVLALLAIG